MFFGTQGHREALPRALMLMPHSGRRMAFEACGSVQPILNRAKTDGYSGNAVSVCSIGSKGME